MNISANYTIPCGLLLLTISLLIRYQIGKRRFGRRGIAGLQHFSSYGKAVIIGLLEKLCLLIAGVLGLVGLFLLAIAGIDHLQ